MLRRAILFLGLFAAFAMGPGSSGASTPSSSPDIQITCALPSVIDAKLDSRGGVFDYHAPVPIVVVGSNLTGVAASLEGGTALEVTALTAELILVHLSLDAFEEDAIVHLTNGTGSASFEVTKGPLPPNAKPVDRVVQELGCYVDHFGPLAIEAGLVEDPATFTAFLSSLDLARDLLASGFLESGHAAFFSAMDQWLATEHLFVTDRRDLDVASGLAFVSETLALDSALQQEKAQEFDNKLTPKNDPAVPNKLIEFDKAAIAGLLTKEVAERLLTLLEKESAGELDEDETKELADLKEKHKEAIAKLREIADGLFKSAREAVPTKAGKDFWDENKEVLVEQNFRGLLAVLAGREDGFTIGITLPSVQVVGRPDHKAKEAQIVVIFYKAGFVPKGEPEKSPLRAHEEGHLTVANALYNAYASFITAFVQSKIQGQTFEKQEDYIKALRAAIREGEKVFREKVGDFESTGQTYDERTDHGRKGTADDQKNAANKLAEEIKKKAAEITPKPRR